MFIVKSGPCKGFKLNPIDFIKKVGTFTGYNVKIGKATHVRGSITLFGKTVVINLPIGDFS